jgi:hypothetical protein
MHVQGLNGVTIQGYYDAHDGPTAYFGTAIPDIPNFYLLVGEFRQERVIINCHRGHDYRTKYRNIDVDIIRGRGPSKSGILLYLSTQVCR